MVPTHKLIMDARRQSKMSSGTLEEVSNARWNGKILVGYLFVLFQASKIVGCKLERQTDLIFDFYYGACNTYNQPEPKVLLCFDSTNSQQCHTWVKMSNLELYHLFSFLRFDGELYHSAGSSSYSHRRTMGMANYLGKALTTGCYGNSECYVKTELMDMNTLTWSSGPDYPFLSS